MRFIVTFATAATLAAAGCGSTAPTAGGLGPSSPPVPTATAADSPAPLVTSSAAAQPTSTPQQPPSSPAQTAPAPATHGAGPPATPVAHDIIELPHKPGMPIVALDSVWVASRVGGVVMRLDAETDELIATIDVNGQPSEYGLVAIGSDVWVPVGECASLDVYSCHDGFLARIDSATNEVVEKLDMDVWGYSIAVHEDTMWVTSFLGNRVLRIDMLEREIVAEIAVTEPTGIVADEEGAWTPRHFTGLLGRIDADTNSVEFIDVGTAATEFVALTDDAVWVTSGENSHEITVVSRDTDEVVDRIAAGWPQGITVHDGTVWVAATGTDDPPGLGPAVLAIDSTTHEIVGQFALPPEIGPWGLDTDGQTVWAVAGEELVRFGSVSSGTSMYRSVPVGDHLEFRYREPTHVALEVDTRPRHVAFTDSQSERGIVLADIAGWDWHHDVSTSDVTSADDFFRVADMWLQTGVEDVRPAVLAGHDGFSGRVRAAGFCPCAEEDHDVDLRGVAHVFVADVDDRLIFVRIWAGSPPREEHLASWLPIATEFLDSGYLERVAP